MEIPKGWVRFEINSEDVEVLPGFAFSSEYFNQERGVPLIRIRDLDTNTTETLFSGGYDKQYIVKKNDILVGMDGEFNIVLWKGRDALLNQRVCRLKSKNQTKMDELFFYYAITKPLKKVEAATGQTTVKHLSTKDIFKIKIHLPPLPEQQRIAEILSTVDDAIQKSDAIIAKAGRLKRGVMQKLLTEGIGHKEFKETELGRVPKEWEIKTFDQTNVELIDGDRGINYPKQEEFQKDGFCLFLNTKNVSGEKFDFADCAFISKEKDMMLRKGRLNKRDLVLTTRGTVGNVALFDKNVKFENIRINSGMIILRNEGNLFDTDFLYLLLRSPLIKNQFSSFSTGSAQPQLPIRDIKKIKLVVPHLPEQQRIAEILSSIDNKIELERKRKAKLERIKKGLMNDLLSGRKRVKVS